MSCFFRKATQNQPSLIPALTREIKLQQNTKMNDLVYCNKKFDHLYTLVDRVLAFDGVVSGLQILHTF